MIQSELDMSFSSTFPSSPTSSSSPSSSAPFPAFPTFAHPLLTNVSTQLSPQDVYMWLALWLDQAPWSPSPKMGCVLVNSHLDQVMKLECTTIDGLLATQKALLQFPWQSNGPFTLYCSRFPSTVCCKLMVQCGIQRCFYFPASLTPSLESPLDQYQAVMKLVQNSNLALTLYLPQWLTPLPPTSLSPTHIVSTLPYSSSPSATIPPIPMTTPISTTMPSSTSSSFSSSTSSSSCSILPSYDPKKNSLEHPKLNNNNEEKNHGYFSSPSLMSSHLNKKMSMKESGIFSYQCPTINPFYINPRSTKEETFHTWIQRFEMEWMAFQLVVQHYFQMTPQFVTPSTTTTCSTSSSSSSSLSLSRQDNWTLEDRQHMYHGLVLAHILSRRTDDPKIGVGAVLFTSSPRGYLSAGYNRFFNCPSPYAFPRLGADELQYASQEVKYPFTIHAEQHCCLYTSPWIPKPLSLGLSPTFFSSSCACFMKAMPVWTLVTTKYPCDECAPLIKGLGVHRVVTLKRRPRGSMPSSSSSSSSSPSFSSLPTSSSLSPKLFSTTLNDSTQRLSLSNEKKEIPEAEVKGEEEEEEVMGVHAHRGLTYTKLEKLFSSFVLLE